MSFGGFEANRKARRSRKDSNFSSLRDDDLSTEKLNWGLQTKKIDVFDD